MLSEWDVLDAISAAWLQFGSTAARDFLCDALAKYIAEVRVSAEADFDRAVAVAWDGKKIVHADRVLVVREDGSVISYQSEAFAQNKIKTLSLGYCTVEFQIILNYRDRETGNSFTGHNCIRGQYVMRHAGGRVCITHVSLCPEPLPPGGQVLEAGVPVDL